MNCKLYKVSDDPRRVNKTIDNPIVSMNTIEPYQPLSDVTGTVIVTYTSDGYACNYAKVDNKHFFITDREVLTGGLMRLILHSDVLMNAYALGLGRVEIVLGRSSNQYNSFIMDRNLPIEVAKYNYLVDPVTGSWDSSITPRCELNYEYGSLIACIVGSDAPTSVEVVQT